MVRMGGKEDANGFLSIFYHALRTKRRREVIRVLHQAQSQTVSVRRLAREIAATEHGLPLTHATGEPYRNAYNALSQTHLPTLADAGIVIYDPQRQMVSSGPNLTTAALLIAINRPAIETLARSDLDDTDSSDE